MSTYAILETSLVPYGHEPTVLWYADTYEQAVEYIRTLEIEDSEGCYEFCEA